MIRRSMLAALPIAVTLLGGCSSSGPSEGPTGEAVQAASDVFARIGEIKGEAKDKEGKPSIVAAAFEADGSGKATFDVAWDCVGPYCHVTVLSAMLQSGPATADGPTSVWEVPSQSFSPNGHVLAHGSDDDPTFEAKLNGGAWSTLAPADSVVCDPCEGPPIKGLVCIPQCTLGEVIP